MLKTIARPFYMSKYIPSASCVLWLPGEGDPYGSIITDRSGKRNNGTITGATWTRLPSGLWGLDFDGADDLVSCGYTGIVAGITPTCMAWVIPDTGYGEATPRIMSHNISAENGGMGYAYITAATGIPSVTWKTVLGNCTAVSSVAVSVGVPTLVGWDYDNDYAHIYVNGALKGTSAQVTSTLLATGANILWGCNQPTDRAYNGRIYWQRIILSVLTAAQHAEVFNRERSLFGV